MRKYLSLYLLMMVLQLSMTRTSKAVKQHISKREFVEVCYDELGCYNLMDHFHPIYRPLPVLPMPRLLVHTTFHLYTRKNVPNNGAQEIKADVDSVKNSYFDPSKPIKYIVHGYLDSASATWVKDMAKALLTEADLNVIAVDWSLGSAGDYFSSASNTWIVGGEMWLLSKLLVENFGVKYNDIHMIGHSLGSHASAYAGARTNGSIGRITGLDPAQPLFKDLPSSARLDYTDAQFVDAIHTDAKTIWLLGFGMTDPAGHMDFYPNEGKNQPGCFIKAGIVATIKEGIVAGIRDFAACNHQRAIFMFTESILSTCPFVAHECSDYNTFENGQCVSCGADSSHCARAGYYSYQHPNPTGAINRKFFLNTADTKPLCVYHFAVTVTLFNSHKQDGHLDMILYGTQVTHGIEVDLKATTSKNHTFLVRDPLNFGEVKSIDVTWTVPRSLLNPFTWFRTPETLSVEKIRVQPMDVLPETARIAVETNLCQKKREELKHDNVYRFELLNECN